MMEVSEATYVLQKPCIFEFDAFHLFLSELYHQNKQADQTFSYKKFAECLGFTSLSSLAMLVSGRRLPSLKVLHKLCLCLNFDERESSYAECLNLLSRAQTESERRKYLRRLSDLRGVFEGTTVSGQGFSVMSQWYYLAIFEMTNMKSCQWNAQWMADRFNNEISPLEAQVAMDALVQHELVRVGENGRAHPVQSVVSTPDLDLDKSTQFFHRQMLARAEHALDNAPVKERYFNGMTLVFDNAQMDKVSRLLNEFYNRLAHDIHSPEGSQVYYINTQFFPVTQL